MIELRLMHDWHCTPVWWNVHDGELVGPVDREDLPISESLWALLDSWVQRMDATMNPNDPRECGFKTEVENQKWVHEGHELWLRLREELGPGYRVVYSLWGSEVRTPEDYPLPQ